VSIVSRTEVDDQVSRRAILGWAAGTSIALLVGSSTPASARRRIDVICRSAWGAEPPSGRFVRHRIRRLTVHHSGSVLRDNREAPGRLRAFQRFHQGDQGWPDIAYHLLIDRNGNVFAGRPRWARGDTATDYNPRGHLLVMCDGNFTRQRPSDAQVRSLVDVLAWASGHYDVNPATIAGHRDYVATACPGSALSRLIDHGILRRRVRRRLRAGGVELSRVCGREGRRRVRAIEAGTD